MSRDDPRVVSGACMLRNDEKQIEKRAEASELSSWPL